MSLFLQADSLAVASQVAADAQPTEKHFLFGVCLQVEV